jgi:hypothetical protein
MVLVSGSLGPLPFALLSQRSAGDDNESGPTNAFASIYHEQHIRFVPYRHIANFAWQQGS